MGHYGRDIPRQPQVGGIRNDGQLLLVLGLRAHQIVRSAVQGRWRAHRVLAVRRFLRGRAAVYRVRVARYRGQDPAGDPGYVARPTRDGGGRRSQAGHPGVMAAHPSTTDNRTQKHIRSSYVLPECQLDINTRSTSDNRYRIIFTRKPPPRSHSIVCRRRRPLNSPLMIPHLRVGRITRVFFLKIDAYLRVCIYPLSLFLN